MDCERNAVSTYARNNFSQKALQGKSKKDMIIMLKEEVGIDWEKDVPFIFKHGVYIKKMNYQLSLEEKSTLDQKFKSSSNVVTRTKAIYLTFKIKYNDYFRKFLLDKLYDIEEGNNSTEITELDINSI